MSEKVPRDLWVMAIGIGKMIKMLGLLGLSTAALFLVHRDVVEQLRHWSFVLGLDPGSHLVRLALEKSAGLDALRLREIGVFSFVYACLFGVEGTGLLLRRRWGEWVTIFITGSFIPIEVYETALHVHVGRVVVILLNVAAVLYLAHRIRRRSHLEHLRDAVRA